MVYLISLILLLLPAYLIRFSILGIPTTLLEVLIYFIFIYGLYQARQAGFRKIPPKIFLPVGFLIIALTASVVIAPDKRVALGEFKGFFIDPILVFWLIYQFVKSKDISKLFIVLILSGTLVAIYTIFQKILGQTTPDGRVIGLFGYSPNYVALFLAPIAVMLTTYSFRLTAEKKNYWLLAVGGLLLALNLLAIYFSGSRGGILAIFGGLAIFALIHFWSWIRQRISSQIILVILILMAIYTSWTFLKPDFTVSQESGGRVATSNNLRWQIWQTSLELGGKHPILGVGLGNFQDSFDELTRDRGNFPEYITPMALTPHNIFLMFWLSTGLLGLASFIWILFGFYQQAVKHYRSNPTAVVLVAVMSTMIIYGLVEASIWKNDLSIIFWVMWGLVWVTDNANLKVQNAK